MLFKNRQEAGFKLGQKLKSYSNNSEAIVLALARGGVPVAYEAAKLLNLSLDVIVVRKIGAPANPELALGAITLDGQTVWDQTLIEGLRVSQSYLDQKIKLKKQEVLRRQKLYRGQKPPLILKDKIVILIDDGIATGSSILAAVKSVKTSGPNKIIIATPVIAADTIEKLKSTVDELIYLSAPIFFMSVGSFYDNFEQTEDEEVVKLLTKNRGKYRLLDFIK